MVKVILDEGLEHAGDCRDLATGVADLRALVADADLHELAARCDVELDQIEEVARDFAGARGAMVVTADLNADGRNDIVWKNGDGSVTLWTMNGANVTAATNV